MNLPTDAAARKSIPVYSGFVRYFPKAMAAVAELSRIGNDQHNPGQPLHWDRSKSKDELDACMRHLLEAGTIDDDGVRHSTKAAWRAMANLEKELELASVQKAPAFMSCERGPDLNQQIDAALDALPALIARSLNDDEA